MATTGQQLTAPEAGWRRYENTNTGFQLSGNWFTESHTSHSGGSCHYSTTIGDKLSFKFYGTKIRFIGSVNTMRSTNIQISIDGNVETFSQYDNQYNGSILNYEKTGLQLGYHEVELTTPFSSSSSVGFDAIDIDENGYLCNQIGQSLTSPEPDWKRCDLTLSHVKTDFTTGSNSAFIGGYNISTQTAGKTLKFDFIGTKIRILQYTWTDHATQVKITIDGVTEFYSEQYSTGATTLVYEKTGLSNQRHSVVIESVQSSVYTGVDAIDIDSTGRLLHPDEVTDIRDLTIGKRIRFNYAAFNGFFGTLSNLGKETGAFIPTASSATPNGDAYFIMVDTDYKGRKVLVADRNIQHSISWDILNTEGVASGSGLPLMVFSPDLVPVMTGATFGSVTVTGSHANPWYCFDGNTYASTLTYYSMGSSGGYVQVDFGAGNEKAVTAYNLKTINWSDLSWQPKDWKLEGSNDGADWVLLHTVTGEKFAQGQRKQYVFNNSTKYRFYKLTVTANNGDIYRTAIDDIEFFESIGLDGYKFTLRLLTGGVSSADTDNEWDKYIVNSTLNGTITAGDNNVWNWNVSVGSWTSTTANDGADKRVRRGYSNNISNHTSLTSNTSNVNTGFRPMLTIESLFEEQLKYLFEDAEGIKTYDIETSSWVLLQEELSDALFEEYGMDDLEAIFDSESSPINELVAPFYVLVQTNNINKNYTAYYQAIPKPQLVLANDDIWIDDVANIDSFTLVGNESGQGILRIIVSFNQGETWHGCKDGVWSEVDITNHESIKTYGMTKEDLAAVSSVSWAELRGISDTIRFGYYLEIQDITDQAETDELISQIDLYGVWEKALESEARYGYTSNINLQVRLYANGTYKINY